MPDTYQLFLGFWAFLSSKISFSCEIAFWKKTKLIRHSVRSGLKFRLKASSADALTEESWLLYERGRLLKMEMFFSEDFRNVCLKTSCPKTCCQILNRRDFAICISRLGNVNNLSECIYWTYCRAFLPGKHSSNSFRFLKKKKGGGDPKRIIVI